MRTERDDLIAWCQQEQQGARRQLDLFAPDGIRALLQMPDGSTQDITEGVVRHQTEIIAAFDRLILVLSSRSQD